MEFDKELLSTPINYQIEDELLGFSPVKNYKKKNNNDSISNNNTKIDKDKISINSINTNYINSLNPFEQMKMSNKINKYKELKMNKSNNNIKVKPSNISKSLYENYNGPHVKKVMNCKLVKHTELNFKKEYFNNNKNDNDIVIISKEKKYNNSNNNNNNSNSNSNKSKDEDISKFSTNNNSNYLSNINNINNITKEPTEDEVKNLNKNLILHKLIFDYDIQEVEKLIKRFSGEENREYLDSIINMVDNRGNCPIFICILLRDKIKELIKDENRDIIETHRANLLKMLILLIKKEAIIRVRNSLGCTPLEEATSNQDKESVILLYERACERRLKKLALGKLRANSFLEQTPDFSFEMKWEVNLPLLSFLAPSDTCKVWKQGKNVRMDYSFIAFKNLSTVRSPSSFFYFGDKGKNLLLNWEKKNWYDQFEPLDREEKDLIINDIMDASRMNSEFKLKNCQISESLSFFKNPIYDTIKGWKSKKYDVKVTAFLDLHHKQKTEILNLSKENYFDKDIKLETKTVVVQTADEMKKKLADNLNVKSDMMKKSILGFGKTKEKNQEASVWIADNFPFKTSYLVNLINSISSANEFTEKIKEFFKNEEMQKIINNNGFPIKIKIPVNILVGITVTFFNFKETKNPKEFEDKFIIPNDIKEISRKKAVDLKANFRKRLKYVNMNL